MRSVLPDSVVGGVTLGCICNRVPHRLVPFRPTLLTAPYMRTPGPIDTAHQRRFATLLFLLLALVWIVPAPAATLELDLDLRHAEVPVGKPLVVLVKLMNSGHEPVVLRGARNLSPGGGFRLSVINDRGQELPVPPRPGLSLAEARSGNARRVLAPGEGIAVPFFIDLIGHARSPGDYTLKATYESPAPTPDNPSINPNHREGVSAQAATIAFRVQVLTP